MGKFNILGLVASVPLTMPIAAWAQEAPSAEAPAEDIIVTGDADRQLLLDARTTTGSRLGLTARETPSMVDIVSERQIRELGARTNVEALNRAPGVSSFLCATSSGLPTMRGFTGGSVGLLYDGIRVATPGIFTRQTDSWLYDRIEILKDPGSILYGEGALAGAINLAPKKPLIGNTRVSASASYGSFDTVRLAGDVNVPVGGSPCVASPSTARQTSSSTTLPPTSSRLLWEFGWSLLIGSPSNYHSTTPTTTTTHPI